jgi:hypothetical protein
MFLTLLAFENKGSWNPPKKSGWLGHHFVWVRYHRWRPPYTWEPIPFSSLCWSNNRRQICRDFDKAPHQFTRNGGAAYTIPTDDTTFMIPTLTPASACFISNWSSGIHLDETPPYACIYYPHKLLCTLHQQSYGIYVTLCPICASGFCKKKKKKSLNWVKYNWGKI